MKLSYCFALSFLLLASGTSSLLHGIDNPIYPVPLAEGHVYDQSDFYGMNVPNEIYPDARGTAGDAAMAALRDQLNQAGVKWLRTDVSANLHRTFFENHISTQSVGLFDVNKLEGFKVLGVINHVTINSAYSFFPSTYGFGPGSPSSSNFTLQQWERVVDYVSKHFKGKVQAYEIWNEPTAAPYIGGYQNGTPQNYFTMLKRAYEIIKANDPDAIVVGLGGMFLWGGDASCGGSGCFAERDKQFAMDVKNLGGQNYADVISVHGYSWENPYQDWLWNTFADNAMKSDPGNPFASYHQIWNKPVWVTEIGYKSDWQGSQSAFMDNAYNFLINAGVSHISTFALKDTMDGSFGLLGRPSHDFSKELITKKKSGLLRIETTPPVGANITVTSVDVPASPPMQRSWGVSWERLQKGQYSVALSYLDKNATIPVEIKGKNIAEIKVDMTVSPPTYSLAYVKEADVIAVFPTLGIANPADGATVSGVIAISGTAQDAVALSKVEVQVDTGGFNLASGLTNWSYSLDTSPLFSGNHTITVKATNASGNSQATTVTVNVKNNLASNPGFESDKSNWLFPSAAAIDAAIFHSGLKSAKIARTGYGTSTIDKNPRMAVVPGTVYTAEVWVKHSNILVKGEGGVRALLEWHGASGSSVRTDVIVGRLAGTADWKKYSMAFASPANAATVNIRLQHYNSKGTVWFDDVGLFSGNTLSAAPALNAAQPVYDASELAAPDTGDDASPPSAPIIDATFKLGEVFAYPNPAVGAGHLTFHVETGSADRVDIKIYNDIGESVHETRLTEPMVADNKLAYEYSWNLAGIPSGTYFYVVESRKAEFSPLRSKGKVAILK